MLIVTARLAIQPGMTTEVEQLLPAFVSACRLDEGCISYEAFSDRENAQAFFFFEKWATKEDWDDHMKTPHVLDFIARIAAMQLSTPEIKAYSVAGIK